MKNKKTILKITLIIIIIMLAFYMMKIFDIDIRNIKIDDLVDYISTYGKFAMLCFLIICLLKPLLICVPSAMFSIIGGILFGPIIGFILSMVGFFLSGTVAFSIARFLGQSKISQMLKGRAADINANIEKNGFKMLLLLRLPPVLPYDPLSYTCGLSKIRYRDFILASIIGVVPETLCYSVMGRNIFNPYSAKFIVPLAFIIFATASATFFFKKAKDL
ncbi:VTT domain-containing protein [uncultured Clostridium sp.]|uniref:TVP38/TMEM64 family protein n=1 Tax=uncultured Clostridium sp. TaxID=59620 RepID=UPI0028E50FBB|nr:VTT domain-containing protein [uncultured Clostridium sp.]